MRPSKNSHNLENCNPIKRLRLLAELSQEQLAKEINVAVSTIRRWEKGQAEPTMTRAQMKAFCEAIKVDFKDLPELLATYPEAA